jgi:hypothetical protein
MDKEKNEKKKEKKDKVICFYSIPRSAAGKTPER